MGTQTITARELIDAQSRGAKLDLIDVRSPAEFETLHARGARSVPLGTLDVPSIAAERTGCNEPLYLICQSGTRARQAFERFKAAGLSNVIVVDGGTAAWERAGGPILRSRKTISLERQVRLAAGTLVLMGLVLAATVSLWFALLAAFIGAGLVVSGVTDTCGMGMVLARMPWNQARPDACDQRGSGGASRTASTGRST